MVPGPYNSQSRQTRKERKYYYRWQSEAERDWSQTGNLWQNPLLKSLSRTLIRGKIFISSYIQLVNAHLSPDIIQQHGGDSRGHDPALSSVHNFKHFRASISMRLYVLKINYVQNYRLDWDRYLHILFWSLKWLSAIKDIYIYLWRCLQ